MSSTLAKASVSNVARRMLGPLVGLGPPRNRPDQRSGSD